jgi:tRNA pseudouridine55 synthase
LTAQPHAVPPLDGVLVVHKPVGPTSHDVVICARRSLGVRRIGHTGTLDPQASGVLPLVVGQATRLARHLSGTNKEYDATIRFGVSTTTYDASGEIVEESGRAPSREEVAAALPRFVGTYAQTPPLYSAKMVGGERSYVRARAGKPVQPPAVPVTVHALELLEHDGQRARVRVRCSPGFYVRSLAHDLGRQLRSGAILEQLRRTEAAGFRLTDAVPFETLVTAPRAELRDAVQPMEKLLLEVPAALLTAEGVRWARHGRDLSPAVMLEAPARPSSLVRMIGPDGRCIGLGEPARMPGFLHPAVVFS